MFRIIRTKKLTALRSRAAGADNADAWAKASSALAMGHFARARAAEELADQEHRNAANARERAATSSQLAADAAARARAAVAERDELQRSIVYRLTQIRNEALHPDRGEEIRGALALHILRGWVADATAESDEEVSGQLRILGTLLAAVESPTSGQQPTPSQAGCDAQ
jgi:hypothetical protein